MITESILLFLSGVICILAVRKYYVIWKSISSRNQNANLAYLGIMIWWFSNHLSLTKPILLRTLLASSFTFCIHKKLMSHRNWVGFQNSTLHSIGVMPLRYKLYSSLCLIIGRFFIYSKDETNLLSPLSSFWGWLWVWFIGSLDRSQSL